MEHEIAQAIALLTAEYDLPAFSDERIEMWMEALRQFPPGSVMASTRNYIRTNRFKPQLAVRPNSTAIGSALTRPGP
jgi:hypothetical protein